MKTAIREIIEGWKEPTWESTVEGSLTEVECELENCIYRIKLDVNYHGVKRLVCLKDKIKHIRWSRVDPTVKDCLLVCDGYEEEEK